MGQRSRAHRRSVFGSQYALFRRLAAAALFVCAASLFIHYQFSKVFISTGRQLNSRSAATGNIDGDFHATSAAATQPLAGKFVFVERASQSTDVLVTCAQKTECCDGFSRLYVLYPQPLQTEMPTSVNAEAPPTITTSTCNVVVKLVAYVGDASAAALNAAMMDAYLDDGVDRFQVVFNFTQDFPQHPAAEIWKALGDRRVAIAVQQQQQQQGTSTSSTPSSSHPSSLYLTNIHFEIFGVFLPPSVPLLPAAVSHVIDLYAELNRRANIAVLRLSAVGNNPQVKVVWDAGGTRAESNRSPAFSADMETLRRYLSAVESSSCFRCPPLANPPDSSTSTRSPRRVISMSLYGDGRRYTMGAVRNAQLAPVTFPGWRLRFYREPPGRGTPRYPPTIPASVERRLRELGAELVDAPADRLAPMMWRFSIADDPEVDVFIVRDADARLTWRDAETVADWLKRDPVVAAFHCIRDHPSHSGFSVSGGLWGAHRARLASVFSNISFQAAMAKYSADYIEDMNFLGREVWPRVQSVAFCHDSFSCENYPSSHPFTVRRVGQEHLGQVYDQLSIGRQGDMDLIAQAAVNAKCVPP